MKTILFILDLSGYTQFITTTSILHAKEVITNILHQINEFVARENPELALNKVEGDALFFFSRTAHADLLTELSKKIHIKFHQILDEVGEQNKTCKFNFCQHVGNMHIKFFIHEGEVHTHRIGHFEELIGRAVIEIHRLMKNGVHGDSYILTVANEGKRSETYEHLGTIRYDVIFLHPTE